MKNLAMLAAMAAASVAFADMKIGTVDMIMLVRNHSSYEPNKKLLNDTEKDYAKKVDRMKADLDDVQDEGKKLSEQLRNPMLAPAAKAKLEKELLDVQNKFLSGQRQ